MPDNAQASNQQMVVIALVVIAVLLAAIIGVLIYQQTQAVPAPSAATAATTAGATDSSSSSAQAPAGMQAQAAAPGPFDPKTATKVPSGMDPAALVKAYNEDVIAGKYPQAYALLPIDKQKSYGDVNAYAQQLKSYGITSYKMGAAQGSGNDVTIAAEQVTPQMPITYTWEFKKVGNQWYVASRTMGGTVQ